MTGVQTCALPIYHEVFYRQRFVAGYIDADYDHPIVLQIKLKGVSKIIDQCPCGHKRDSDERYCPKCGNVLAVGVAA